MANKFEADQRDLPEAWGEYPPNIEYFPGSIKVDDVANPHNLQHLTQLHLEQHPKIREEALRNGKDLVAVASSHGKQIIIGVGVASIATAIGFGAIVLYKKSHSKR